MWYVFSNFITTLKSKNKRPEVGSMERKPIAAEYIALNEIWNNTSKETLISNVTKYLVNKFPECDTSIAQQKKIAEITDSKIHTVYAWINLSREQVKIPLLKLCVIADAIDIDIMKLLKENKE